MKKKFNVPCLDCGGLTRGRNRCDTHYRKYLIKYEATRNRSHYKGDYQTRAKRVRESATVCWLCLEAFTDPREITADHYYPGDPLSPLLPAHLSCNSSRQDRPPDTPPPDLIRRRAEK
jgi:hypothetical protein